MTLVDDIVKRVMEHPTVKRNIAEFEAFESIVLRDDDNEEDK